MNTTSPVRLSETRFSEARDLIAEELMRNWGHLGASLRDQRELRGISIEDAAEFSEIDEDSIRDFEDGTGDLLFSEILDLSVTVLARIQFNVHDGRDIARERSEANFAKIINMMDHAKGRSGIDSSFTSRDKRWARLRQESLNSFANKAAVSH